jgi:hypothetical protein
LTGPESGQALVWPARKALESLGLSVLDTFFTMMIHLRFICMGRRTLFSAIIACKQSFRIRRRYKAAAFPPLKFERWVEPLEETSLR